MAPSKTSTTPDAEYLHVLKTLGWDDASSKALATQIASLSQLRITKEDDLRTTIGALNLSLGQYAELSLFRHWYKKWKKDPNKTTIDLDFTEDVWDDFVDDYNESSGSIATPLTTSSGATVASSSASINTNFKIEAKEFPKLPKNTNLKGQVYNDWHDVFTVKLKQAGVGALLDEKFTLPAKLDPNYKELKIKDDYLNNMIISAALSSNAYAYIDPDDNGYANYRELNSVFKGDDHIKNTATRAVDIFSKLEFGKSSTHSPEAFLSKFMECLKQMKDDNAEIHEKLLPGLFRAKVSHSSFDMWKELSEKNNDDWRTTRKDFLSKAEKLTLDKSNSNKFSVQNGMGEQQQEQQIVQDKKKRIAAGERFARWEWKLLSQEEQKACTKVYKEKKAKNKEKRSKELQGNPNQAGGGLPSQYQVQNGFITLPPGQALPEGTTFTPNPSTTFQGMTNNTNLTPATQPPTNNNTPTVAAAPNQANVQRALNMLTLQNGQFSLRNLRVNLSPRIQGVMSVQSYLQQTNAKGACYADSGTNIGAMGRHFRVTAYTGRHADMTGFANDLSKNGVPIASGLTKTITSTGQAVLIGMHEAAYLKNNEASLISTNQSREAGTWVDDVMKRHGGTQRIVGQVEGWDQEAMDFNLLTGEGLLSWIAPTLLMMKWPNCQEFG